MYSVLMIGVMLISPIPCLFVLLRVGEQVTEDSGVKQVKIAEQELVEGKLYP
jgi:type III secretory pathway component EscV